MDCSLWDSVLELTTVSQEKGGDPLVWAIQVSSCLSSAGVSLPSLELANFLVSHICWENNLPIVWKFLEKALVLKIVSPIIVFPLLSSRYLFVFLFFWFPICYAFLSYLSLFFERLNLYLGLFC